MRKQERAVLDVLDRLVHRAALRRKIAARAARAGRKLAADPDARLAWETLPLGWFRRRLPGGIHSAWVFVLRARTDTGAERHPNSLQRTVSWRGRANLETLGRAGWRSHELTSDPRASLERRWLSIPPSTWHRPIVGPRNWVVVSFHTARAAALIEERPDPRDPGRTRGRGYLGGENRKAG
jgi:hypothetical protein